VLEVLLSGKALDSKHKDHALAGDHCGFRECHILPDWLPIYSIHQKSLILIASRTGTHSDLFGE